MKIATLKVAGLFAEDGCDVAYAGEFDEDALEDGPGQALLVYQDGRWHLFTFWVSERHAIRKSRPHRCRRFSPTTSIGLLTLVRRAP